MTGNDPTSPESLFAQTRAPHLLDVTKRSLTAPSRAAKAEFGSIGDLPTRKFLNHSCGASAPEQGGSHRTIYPVREGHREPYVQTPRSWLNKTRHIDFFSSVETPEGCRVDSAYLSRSINEYLDTEIEKDRERELYEIVLFRLGHYLRLRPEVQCGRHRSNDPDANFEKKIQIYHVFI